MTPQGKYFFGGEMTFELAKKLKDKKKNEEEDDENKQFISYIIHSLEMPQQTSLLGMLRFLLLSHDPEAFDIEGNHIRSMEAANELIGKKSFDVIANGRGGNDFGKIVGIGPCCLYDKTSGKYYFKAFPKDYLNVDFAETDKVTMNGHELEIPKIEKKNEKDGKYSKYSPKEPLSKEYVSDDGKPYVPTDPEDKEPIFKEDIRIGIQKNYEGKTEDKALYKQINYRLKKGFCFAFEAEVNGIDLSSTEYSGEIVKLGADASTFLFEAKKLDSNLPYLKSDYLEDGYETKLVLLSDAYLEKPMEREGVLFAITNTKPFRFLRSENSENAEDYNVNNKGFEKMRSPKRYDLYEAGSVFYFKNKDSRKNFCEEYMNKYDGFQKIGYNWYCKNIVKQNNYLTMSKNTSVWLIIPQTNLHVGNESVVNFSVIDKSVQRDVVTNIPCINSSSLKGALKEYLTQKGLIAKDEIRRLFGSVKNDKDENGKKNEETQKGSAVFFDANLLFIPECCCNSGEKVYQLAYSNEMLNEFKERAQKLEASCEFNVLFKKAILYGGKIVTPAKTIKEYKELCNDDNLPIIARNCLDNGESVNLWYEQVVPSKSVFATIIRLPNGNELDLLHNQIVQIGAHASIGYGYCKMVKLNKEA